MFIIVYQIEVYMVVLWIEYATQKIKDQSKLRLFSPFKGSAREKWKGEAYGEKKSAFDRY